MLVFFDDIPIYNASMELHVLHLQTMHELLRQIKLFDTQSKCIFTKNQIGYLGHVISKSGVSADSNKIDGMLKWPTPKSIKGLRGFLGLTCCYRGL